MDTAIDASNPGGMGMYVLLSKTHNPHCFCPLICEIIIIMVMFKCYFSREHKALSLEYGVNIKV